MVLDKGNIMDNKTDKIRKFGTSEIPLAAFLVSSGCLVVEVVKLNQYKSQFNFVDVDKELIDNFNYDLAKVNPKSFANTMSGLFQRAKQNNSEA